MLFAWMFAVVAAWPAHPVGAPASAYLWQRDNITQAVVDSDRPLHVLVIDASPATAVVWERALGQLRASRYPMVLVARVSRLDIDVVTRLLAHAQQAASAGVSVAGVALDYDCAVSQLPAYARFLQALRLRTAWPLEITALPAWLQAPAHAAVFAAADNVVLQLHAVAAPALFDVDAAGRAVATFRADRSSAHGQLALPSYAVTLNDGRQLHADPAQLAQFIVRAGLTAADIVWFRLPSTIDDPSAWGSQTLSRVSAGTVEAGVVTARVTPNADGSVDVHVHNRSDVDVALPAVRVAAAVFDAFAAFTVRGDSLVPVQARFLRPGADVVAGWARTDGSQQVVVSVERAP